MNRPILRGRALRRAALCLSTVLASGLAAPALAQTSTPPPERLTIDEFGVNQAKGTFSTAQDLVSIGIPSGNGLVFKQMWEIDRWRNNFLGYIVDYGDQVQVVSGGETASFTLVDGQYVSDQGNGSTLVLSNAVYGYDNLNNVVLTQGTFTFTSSSGTVSAFNVLVNGSTEGGLKYYYFFRGYDGVTAPVSYVQYPNGRRLDFYYNNVNVSTGGPGVVRTRLKSVKSSDGYQIFLAYRSNTFNPINLDWTAISSVRAINNSLDYCNPTANACAANSQPWPTSSVTEAASGYLRYVTFTDSLGQATRYTVDNYYGRMIVVKPPSSSSDLVTVQYYGVGSPAISFQRVSNIASAGITRSYAWEYDGSSLWTLTTTNALGAQTVVTSDGGAQGLVYSITDEIGRPRSFEYDASGRLTR